MGAAGIATPSRDVSVHNSCATASAAANGFATGKGIAVIVSANNPGVNGQCS
jgi:hypothetical protein